MAHSFTLPCPPLLLKERNIAENWSTFKRQYQDYALATGVDKLPETVHVATFRTILGVEESVAKYVEKLKTRAATCEFGGLLAELIRDWLVLGIQSNSLWKKLLSNKNLTLETAINIASAHELTEQQVQHMAECQDMHKLSEDVIHVVRGSRDMQPRELRPSKTTVQDKRQPAKVNNSQTCIYCVRSHQQGKRFCPAAGKGCHHYKKMGHFATVCRSRQMEDAESKHPYNFIQNQGCMELHDKDIMYFIQERVTGEVDPQLGNSTTVLKCYANTQLILAHTKGTYILTFQIVDLDCTPIISATDSMRLRLIRVKAKLCSVEGYVNRLNEHTTQQKNRLISGKITEDDIRQEF
ncbi:hypothetical protein PR048_017500 [Dryococelus australis]|uniref:Uncharacterized protein n=1 Tax=Dryococelus australis TaxID=614101 RepID=A0ABQ9H9Q0_9NEOP|nr:hypothetical protein PR048_017500 [Dryococelus australis]